MAGNVQLLNLVGVSGTGGGVDGNLEKFAAGIEHADEIFFVGLGRFVGDLEGTRGVGVEEGTENLLGLLAGAVAGRGGTSRTPSMQPW